jgi:dihydrofolate reductase
VDEYRLWIYPLRLGRGKRLFADHGAPASFELVDGRTTTKGATVMRLRRAGEVEHGSS